MFITALFITTVAERDPNSDDGFFFGTIPLISLMLLMVLLKVIHIFVTIGLEYKKRNTTKKSGDKSAAGGIFNPGDTKHCKAESDVGFQKDDGFDLDFKASERANLFEKKEKKTGDIKAVQE